MGCGVSACQTVGRVSSKTTINPVKSSVSTPTNKKLLDLRPKRLTSGESSKVLVASTASVGLPVAKKKTKAKPKKYKLKELLKLAWQRSPRLREAQYQLESFRARKSEAIWTSWWPQGSVTAVVAPAPPARGDATTTTTPYPEAYNRLNQYGVLTRVELSLVWPLYTFGKLTLLQKAATHGVRLGQTKILLEKSKWEMLVKEAYFGLQFAESSLVLLDEAEEQIREAKKRVKGKTDKLKMQVIESQVLSRRVQAEMAKRIAESGLARLSGLPTKPAIQLQDPELEEAEIKIHKLKEYQRLARLHRPELGLLTHALRAKRALLNAQRRMWLPDFFIGAFFRWGYSSAADDQMSPFARDDFNFLEAAGVLGVRWSLDVPITLTKIRRAEADFEAFRSRKNLAEQGIKMQVEQRYRELVAANKLVSVHKTGRKAANKWMTKSMIAFGSGLVDTKEVSDALLAYAQTQFAYLESMYKLKVAVARLTRAVGLDITLHKGQSEPPTKRR